MIDLSGKVALITGSSRGIGRGCAVEMARAGASVTVNYHSHKEDGEAVAEEIRSLGREALVFGADVSDRAQVDRMVEATVEQFGQLDIVVCNAYSSSMVGTPFLERSIDEIKKTFDVSLWGAFHTAQASARHMVARGAGGSILFMSSVASITTIPGTLSYSTLKAAMNHMASIIASELTPHRIRVNVITPGLVDTPAEREYLTTDEQIQQAGERLPWGRIGTIEDIGKVATFLSSDAADYITGANLRVDGGQMLQAPSP